MVAALAADARVARAAERRLQVAHVEAVDPYGAGGDGSADPVGPGFGSCVDGGGEAVLGGVGFGDRLVVVLEGLKRQDRPEDLVVEDLRARGRP